jgi:AraC-like DNA-binding protein
MRGIVVVLIPKSQLERFNRIGINSTMPHVDTLFRWPLKALPQVTVAGQFPLDERGFSYEYRSPTHAIHLYDYQGQIRISQNPFPIRPGDVTITPAGAISSYDLPKPGHHWCIHFEPLPARGELTQLPIHFSLGSMHDSPTERGRDIARLQAQNSKLSLAAGSAALQELLLWLAMQAQAQSHAAHNQRSLGAVERVAAIVHARFTEPLTVPELADEVGMTQNYLARMFRRRFGMTIPRYLLNRRIEYARHLLMTTNIPVSRVALRVGLPDPQHFNKQFRRLTGMSPSHMRSNRG